MAMIDPNFEQRLSNYRAAFDLSGKTALVLGAASGIGKASAEALAALGANVICADKDRDGRRAHGGRDRHDGQVAGACDRCRQAPATSTELAASARKTFAKRLDIAVTTPAIHIRKPFLDYSDEEYDRIVDLNLRGVFLFLRAFGRIMRDQNGGSLIATSSMRAMTLEPGLAIYAATKAGIIQLVRGLGLRTRARITCASTPWCRASSTPRWCSRSKRGRRSSRSSPPTPCSTAGASRAKWRTPSRSSHRMRPATSPAARMMVDGGWTAIDGPPSGLTETSRA